MAIELEDGTLVRSLPEQVDYLTTANNENEIAIDNLAARLEAAIAGVLHYKGSVATYADLPANAEIGDVYNVIDTGSNYAWTGEEWDELGSSIDISSLVDLTSAQTITGQKTFKGGIVLGQPLDPSPDVELRAAPSSLQIDVGQGSLTITDDQIRPSGITSLGTSSYKFNEAWLSTALNLGASGIIKHESGAFTLNDDLLPAVTASYDLGGNSNAWKNLYLTGNVSLVSGTTAYNVISLDNSNRININYNGNVKMKVGNSEIWVNDNLYPDSNDTYNLGYANAKWKNLYLSGKLTDGTNEVNIADLKALIDYAKAQGWIS